MDQVAPTARVNFNASRIVGKISADPHYAAWRQSDRPLASLKPLIDILQFDRLSADASPGVV